MSFEYRYNSSDFFTLVNSHPANSFPGEISEDVFRSLSSSFDPVLDYIKNNFVVVDGNVLAFSSRYSFNFKNNNHLDDVYFVFHCVNGFSKNSLNEYSSVVFLCNDEIYDSACVVNDVNPCFVWIDDYNFALNLNSSFVDSSGSFNFQFFVIGVSPDDLIQFTDIIYSSTLVSSLELDHKNDSAAADEFSSSDFDSVSGNTYIYQLTEPSFVDAKLSDLSVNSVLLICILIILCFRLVIDFVKELF